MNRSRLGLTVPKINLTIKPILPLGLDKGAGQEKGIKENPLTRAKIELGGSCTLILAYPRTTP